MICPVIWCLLRTLSPSFGVEQAAGADGALHDRVGDHACLAVARCSYGGLGEEDRISNIQFVVVHEDANGNRAEAPYRKAPPPSQDKPTKGEPTRTNWIPACK